MRRRLTLARSAARSSVNSPRCPLTEVETQMAESDAEMINELKARVAALEERVQQLEASIPGQIQSQVQDQARRDADQKRRQGLGGF